MTLQGISLLHEFWYKKQTEQNCLIFMLGYFNLKQLKTHL